MSENEGNNNKIYISVVLLVLLLYSGEDIISINNI